MTFFIFIKHGIVTTIKKISTIVFGPIKYIPHKLQDTYNSVVEFFKWMCLESWWV